MLLSASLRKSSQLAPGLPVRVHQNGRWINGGRCSTGCVVIVWHSVGLLSTCACPPFPDNSAPDKEYLWVRHAAAECVKNSTSSGLGQNCTQGQGFRGCSELVR